MMTMVTPDDDNGDDDVGGDGRKDFGEDRMVKEGERKCEVTRSW